MLDYALGSQIAMLGSFFCNIGLYIEHMKTFGCSNVVFTVTSNFGEISTSVQGGG